jgi:hypothetical protein
MGYSTEEKCVEGGKNRDYAHDGTAVARKSLDLLDLLEFEQAHAAAASRRVHCFIPETAQFELRRSSRSAAVGSGAVIGASAPVLCGQEWLAPAAVGSGLAGSGAVGSGAAGSGAVISGAAGSGAVGSGVAGSGAVGSGAAGSGAVGSGVAGSVPVGSGAVDVFVARGHGKISLRKPTRSRRMYGIIRNGRWNWNCKSRNRHAFPNFRGRLPSGLHWAAKQPFEQL